MPDEVQPATADDQPMCYRISVRGGLDADWSDWFAGLQVVAAGDVTQLIGPMDQAALHGVLKRVRDLGLPLIAVQPEEERCAPRTSPHVSWEPLS